MSPVGSKGGGPRKGATNRLRTPRGLGLEGAGELGRKKARRYIGSDVRGSRNHGSSGLAEKRQRPWITTRNVRKEQPRKLVAHLGFSGIGMKGRRGSYSRYSFLKETDMSM